MLTPRIRAALVVLAASAGLGACTNFGPYGGLGVGLGNGYGSYGYNPYYSGYGYNPYGWYNGYYYPGSGYWVYDPDGHHHPIDDNQKAYWSNLRDKIRAARGAQATTTAVQENWSAFSKHGRVPATVAAGSARADQSSLRQLNEARRQAQVERQQQARIERQQVQSERAQARVEARQERRVRRGASEE